MIRRLRSNEKGGVALLIVVAFMVLALPMASSAFGQASTLSVDSGVKTRILKSQYAAMGGTQHAVNRLLYENGYYNSFTQVGVPSTYDLPLNGKTVTVTVTKTGTPQSLPKTPKSTSSPRARRLQVTKTVFPAAASPNVPTLFTYTITVTNLYTLPLPMNRLHDELPDASSALLNFTYVPGSTTTVGFPASEPTIDGQDLIWDPPDFALDPQQSVSLTFRALATLPTGNYCNEAWLDPGGRKKGTHKTAKVRVGSPPDDRCTGIVVEFTKGVDPEFLPADAPSASPVTYTINIENAGTVTVNLTKIEDWLPYPFTYVNGTTSGFTTADPSITIDALTQRQKLKWDAKKISPTDVITIPPGQQITLAFQANTTTVRGDYSNEFWLKFQEKSANLYSYPEAPVSIFAVFDIVATDGKETSTSEVWLGLTSYLFSEWGIGP